MSSSPLWAARLTWLRTPVPLGSEAGVFISLHPLHPGLREALGLNPLALPPCPTQARCAPGSHRETNFSFLPPGALCGNESARGRWAGHQGPQPQASIKLLLGHCLPRPPSWWFGWHYALPPSPGGISEWFRDRHVSQLASQSPPGTSAGTKGTCHWDCPASSMRATWRRRVKPTWQITEPREKGGII